MNRARERRLSSSGSAVAGGVLLLVSLIGSERGAVARWGGAVVWRACTGELQGLVMAYSRGWHHCAPGRALDGGVVASRGSGALGIGRWRCRGGA